VISEIGTVTRVTGDGVYVRLPKALPGVELGPLLALVHRYRDDSPGLTAHLTAYLAGDEVLVIETTSQEFVVYGIAG
jgi:hypothetical protein